ncbi:MAG: ATP-binding protein [Candidatus Paceibacterota bacterium]|jgi:anti-sigma regulatory factor (Ser/Thr protein kinase)
MGELLKGRWPEPEKEKSPKIRLEWAFDTSKKSIQKVSEVGKTFQEKLVEIGWEEDEAWGLCYGLQEAVTNAFVHGNLGIQKLLKDKEGNTKSTGALVEAALEKLAKATEEEKKDLKKRVEVTVEMDKNRVIVKVRDEGPGFNFDDVKDPTSSATPDEELEASGRGVFLIKKFFNSRDCKKIVDDEGKKWSEVILIREKGKEIIN